MPRDLVDELHLPRVLRVRAGGRTLVLKKRAGESTAHVILKAIAFARYRPAYPDLRVEVPIGLRYKPDLVALDGFGEPRIWIECGHVDREKVRRLVRRYPRTHLVWLRRQAQWEGAVAIVREALDGAKRAAPIEILGVTDETLLSVVESGDAERAVQSVTTATVPKTEG
jgi:hypothetical protein